MLIAPSLPANPSLSLSINLSLRLSLSLSINLSLRLSLSLSLYQSISPSLPLIPSLPPTIFFSQTERNMQEVLKTHAACKSLLNWFNLSVSAARRLGNRGNNRHSAHQWKADAPGAPRAPLRGREKSTCLCVPPWCLLSEQIWEKMSENSLRRPECAWVSIFFWKWAKSTGVFWYMLCFYWRDSGELSERITSCRPRRA